ncbi:MAG: CBS domain-containing protein [Clostridia bacterium]|nr:CBS domain-containing protein [Clostridia bacterium]
MNVLFLLTPKSDVAYVYSDNTLRQVLEKMEHHRYTAIPVINRDGNYVATLTEGDLLWLIKNRYGLDFTAAEQARVEDIPHHSNNQPLPVSTDLNDIVQLALNQNFVPLVDDRGIFIGIITRKNIISYFQQQFSALQAEAEAGKEE